MGAGYARFGRSGSVWRWEFSWNNFYGKQVNLCHGYDKGLLSDNSAIFERLKTRFLKSVILDNKLYERANNFRVYLCDEEDKKNDALVFKLRFVKDPKGVLEAIFELQEFALQNFSSGTIAYLRKLFADYTFRIQQATSPSPKTSLSVLVKEINQEAEQTRKVVPATSPSSNKAMMFWQNMCKACFTPAEQIKLNGIRVQVDEKQELFLVLLTQDQYDFLEEAVFEKWAWYFQEHLPTFKIQYQLLQQPTLDHKQEANQIVAGLLQKFKV
jgi:hypothetical protein